MGRPTNLIPELAGRARRAGGVGGEMEGRVLAAMEGDRDTVEVLTFETEQSRLLELP